MQKIVLITGASSGIGKAVAEYLTTKNYKVYGTSRNPKEDVINKVHFLPLDVTKPKSIKLAIKAVIDEEGKIDYLINNAGKGITGPIEEIPEEELKEIFETNYFGPLNMIKAVLPHMRKERSGMILNITSIAGYMGLPYRGAYSATKGALALTTEALRMEVKEFDIQVVNVAPGDFATNIASGRYHAPVMPNSPYRTNYARSLQLMDAHVDDGQNPEVMALAVHKIMQKDKPKVHYKVGVALQKVSVLLKGILPSKMYEKLLLNHYKL